MLAMLVAAAVTIAQAAGAPAAPACGGLAFQSVAVKTVTSAAGLNHYQITGTVINNGTKAQPSNTLQFVDIFTSAHQKLNDRGIPPLKPGQTYTFGYTYDRSIQAGNGTSHLVFRIDMRQPAPPANCAPATYPLTF
ncbi:MAG TPA: hypothetical protein VMF61_15665 [Candidatus Acidoferrales bacterium]|nr:hypothetical protein [Candidatus Acidoferrales bacterium]